MKYKVYLFRAEHCTRNWLAYVIPFDDYTLLVETEAENSAKAKNRAITLMNSKQYDKLEILEVNQKDKLWGIQNFPELQKEIIDFLDLSVR